MNLVLFKSVKKWKYLKKTKLRKEKQNDEEKTWTQFVTGEMADKAKLSQSSLLMAVVSPPSPQNACLPDTMIPFPTSALRDVGTLKWEKSIYLNF